MLTTQNDPIPYSLFKQAVDHVLSGIILYQAVRNGAGEIIDFRYLYLNEPATRLTGVSAGTVGSHTLRTLYEHDTTLFDQYKQALITNQPVQFVFQRQPVRELPMRWFHVQVAPMGDHIVCSFSDISEHKRVEATLLEERRRLKEAQAIGRVGSFEWNVGEEQTYWSDELYRIVGLEPIGCPITFEMTNRLTHPADLSALRILEEQCIREPGHYELIHRLIRQDGAEHWVHHQFESLTNEQGQVVRVRGTVQDITEYYTAQRQIQQYAENLQAVLNGSPASIALLKAVRDPDEVVVDFRLVVYNEKFVQLTQKQPEEILGQSFQLLAPLLWDNETFENLVHVLTTKSPRYEERLLPNTHRWLGMSISQQDEGVLVTALDITDLKQMQQQQDELTAQIRQSSEMLNQLTLLQQQVHKQGELWRESSHDLRGSLGVIQGAAGLLGFASNDEERNQMLDILQRNVDQVTQLITNLLYDARMGADQEPGDKPTGE